MGCLRGLNFFLGLTKSSVVDAVSSLNGFSFCFLDCLGIWEVLADSTGLGSVCVGACVVDLCLVSLSRGALLPDAILEGKDTVLSWDDFVSDCACGDFTTSGSRDKAGLLRFRESLDREFLVSALSISTSTSTNSKIQYKVQDSYFLNGLPNN